MRTCIALACWLVITSGIKYTEVGPPPFILGVLLILGLNLAIVEDIKTEIKGDE